MPEMSLADAIQLGYQHLTANRFADAEMVAQQVLAVFPDQPRAVHYLAIAQHQQGRLGEAIPNYERAIALDAVDAEPCCNLAEAYRAQHRYDEAIDQYAHAAGITLLTPEGRVSRYFYGIEYSARDLRLGLVDASANRIGTLVDRVMYLCYHYDPSTGRYGLLTMRLLKAGGLLTMATLGTFWVVMIRRERRKAYAS